MKDNIIAGYLKEKNICTSELIEQLIHLLTKLNAIPLLFLSRDTNMLSMLLKQFSLFLKKTYPSISDDTLDEILIAADYHISGIASLYNFCNGDVKPHTTKVACFLMQLFKLRSL